MTRIRVMVVDDSVVVRKLVTDVLAADPGIEVVGTAPNGKVALSRVDQLGPDLLTMDIEMPEMDGITTVRELRRAGHKMPIIMFSTLTERGAASTLDALAAGATDYITKPTNSASLAASMKEVGENLIPRVKALAGRRRPLGLKVPLQKATDGAAGQTAENSSGATVRSGRGDVTLRGEPTNHPVRVLLIGSSTGGPEALSKVFAGFRTAPPVPVLLVQHMPPVFTRQLALRLDKIGPTTVMEAEPGQVLQAGHAYIAPGSHHLTVRRSGANFVTELDDSPPVNYCRPSVDVMFRSAVKAFGGQMLAVVLTGMGADGRTGSEDLISAGGTVFVQDEPTSVVWGMPGAVASAGLAHKILPIGDMAGAIERRLSAAVTGAGTWR